MSSTNPSNLSTADRKRVRRAALAAFVGTTIEWYDYFIFGTAAALVFGGLFFPDLSPLAGTLAAFSSFAVGFIARPIGSVVFAHFGDRIGRKPMMVWSLALMGAATVLIGLLPTYSAIGILAPIFLVLLRFLQGLGVGGEWGAAALMAVEHAPEGKRGLYGSAPAVGVPAGVLLSSGVFAIMSATTTDAQFEAWGWRIPFLLSAVLIVVATIIRLAVEESPIFTAEVKERAQPTRVPILVLLREYPKTVAIATGLFISANATFYIASTWIVSYATGDIGLDQTTVLNVISLMAAIGIGQKILFGGMSDKVGRKPLYVWGAIAFIVFAFPYFWLINTGALVWFALAVLIAETIRSVVGGPIAAIYSELFDTRVRYSGASLSYQLAAILGGGIAPTICTALLAWAGSYWAVSVYIIVLNVISLVCVRLLPETYRGSLTSTPSKTGQPQEGQPQEGQPQEGQQ
ncbi:metabolite-proton symporter [Tamaricihabitans halophyticus]|uniref:Putative proline/betaine transporter n=1 Tax=Tamaricihabitans halophyticus TaxID=1262583 RepID=A0A4R2QFF6_9PSEU|nr:MFS transporter [Tamaricihabitans halophyticus]TCP47234.1 metabolite-proton symporter [Tamaricihabitans halophyticus]